MAVMAARQYTYNNGSTHFGSNYVPFLDASVVDGWVIKLIGHPASKLT
jgi:hypothetical protein